MEKKAIIIDDEPFYKIPNGTTYTYAPIPKEFRPYFEQLQQENQQLKIQISAGEKECRKLEDKLVETENWLRPAILQLMEIAKQDYYWITDQQIDSAKLVPIEFTVMGNRCVKFKKIERGVSDVED